MLFKDVLRTELDEFKELTDFMNYNSLKREFGDILISKIGRDIYEYALAEFSKNYSGSTYDVITVLKWYLENGKNDFIKSTIIHQLGCSNVEQAIKKIENIAEMRKSLIEGVKKLVNTLSSINSKVGNINDLINELKSDENIKTVLIVLDKSFAENTDLYNKFWSDIEKGFFPSNFANWAERYPSFRKVVMILKDLARISALVKRYKEELKEFKSLLTQSDIITKLQDLGIKLSNRVSGLRVDDILKYPLESLEEVINELVTNRYLYNLLILVKEYLSENKQKNLTDKDIKYFIEKNISLEFIKNISISDLRDLVVVLGIFLELGLVDETSEPLVKKYIQILSYLLNYLQEYIGFSDTTIYAETGERTSLLTGYRARHIITPDSELFYSFIESKYLPEDLKSKIENYKKLNYLLLAISKLLNEEEGSEEALKELKRYIKTQDYKKVKQNLDSYTIAYVENIIEPSLQQAKTPDEFRANYEKLIKRTLGLNRLYQLYLDWLKINYPDDYSSNSYVRNLENSLLKGLNPELLSFDFSKLPDFLHHWGPGSGFVNFLKDILTDKFGDNISDIISRYGRGNKYSWNEKTLDYIIDRYFLNIVNYIDLYKYFLEQSSDGIFGKDEKQNINTTGVLEKYLMLKLSALKDGILSYDSIHKVDGSLYYFDGNKEYKVDVSFFEKDFKDKLKGYLNKELMDENSELYYRLKLFYPFEVNIKNKLDSLVNNLINNYISSIEYLYVAYKFKKVVPYDFLFNFYKLTYILFGNVENLNKFLEDIGMKNQDFIDYLKGYLKFINKNEKSENNNSNNEEKNFLKKVMSYFSTREKYSFEDIDNLVKEILEDDDRVKEFNEYIEQFWKEIPLFVKQSICLSSGLIGNYCTSDNLSNDYIPSQIKAFIIKRILLNSILNAISKEVFKDYIISSNNPDFVDAKATLEKLTFTSKDKIALYLLNAAKELAILGSTIALSAIVPELGIPILGTALEGASIWFRASRFGRIAWDAAEGLRGYYTGSGVVARGSYLGRKFIVEPWIYSKLSGENFGEVWKYWLLGELGGWAGLRGGKSLARLAGRGETKLGVGSQILLPALGGTLAIGGYEVLEGNFDIESISNQMIFMLMLAGLERGKNIGVLNKLASRRMGFSYKLYNKGRKLGGKILKDLEFKGYIPYGKSLPYSVDKDGRVVIDLGKDNIITLEGVKLGEGERILSINGNSIVLFNTKTKELKVLKSSNNLKYDADNKIYKYINDNHEYKVEFIDDVIYPGKENKIIDKIIEKLKNEDMSKYVIIDRLGNVYKIEKINTDSTEHGYPSGQSGYPQPYGGYTDRVNVIGNDISYRLEKVDNIFKTVEEIGRLKILKDDGTIEYDLIDDVDKRLSESLGPQWEKAVKDSSWIKIWTKDTYKSLLNYMKEKNLIEKDLLKQLDIKFKNIDLWKIDDINKFPEIKTNVFLPLKKAFEKKGLSPNEASKRALNLTKGLLKNSLLFVKALLTAPFKFSNKLIILGLVGGVVYDYASDNHLDTLDWIKNNFPSLLDASVVGGETFIGVYGLGTILKWLGVKGLGDFFKKHSVKIALTTAGIKFILNGGGKELISSLLSNFSNKDGQN